MTEWNHYNTLQVSPNATKEEIKKAYRKLALQYHPDIAGDDPAAEEQFRKIKAAYDILGNSKSRQAYHYKYFYTDLKPQPIVTAHSIALMANNLARFTKALDPYRLDTEGLYLQVSQLIDDKNLAILKNANDGVLINTIVTDLLGCSLLLPFDKALSVHQALLNLADKDEGMAALINKQTRQQKMFYYWDRYKLLLALVMAIAICVTMFLLV